MVDCKRILKVLTLSAKFIYSVWRRRIKKAYWPLTLLKGCAFGFTSPTSPALLQSEDIRLDPELYEPCKSDISRLCPNVAFGNAQVTGRRRKMQAPSGASAWLGGSNSCRSLRLCRWWSVWRSRRSSWANAATSGSSGCRRWRWTTQSSTTSWWGSASRWLRYCSWRDQLELGDQGTLRNVSLFGMSI